MVSSQAEEPEQSGASPAPREAQRRRTRAAIVDATTRLVSNGGTPSIDEIATAADVSRRTIYLYFPTLDQLLLDATVGALSQMIADAALDRPGTAADPVKRIDKLVRALTQSAPATLPLGRKIIALTVDAPTTASADTPRRGYRRIQWIEQALEPLRDQLTEASYQRLVSALSIIIGWEAMVVLRDVRALDSAREQDTLRWAATTLVRAALST